MIVKRKSTIIILVIILVLQLIILSGCPDSNSNTSGTAAQTVSSQTAVFTALVSPFDGDGDWGLTQAYGAYYEKFSGHHTGEDWSRLSKDADAGYPVYSIADDGIVYDIGITRGTDPANAGWYMIVKYEGTFKIPASTGAHIRSLSEPTTEKGRASKNGAAIIHSQDLFRAGTLNDYPLGETDLNGSYTVDEQVVGTIYAVYMHIQKPTLKVGDEAEQNQQIGILMGGMKDFPDAAHLHFEIRLADEKSSVLNGAKNNSGYFPESQDMVDVGYLEPSSVIQANNGEESIAGDVLGETDSADNNADDQKLSLAKTTAGYGKLVEQDGDWIYFSLAGIYKCKTDGTGLSKISDAYADYICFSDGWIYGSVSSYEFDDGISIWKMRTDGTEFTVIAEYGNGAVCSFQMEGDWLFLCSPCEIAADVMPESAYGSGGIYRMKTDGSEMTKTVDGNIWYFTVNNNIIYYEDGYPSEDITNNALFKAETDGSSNVQITAEEWTGITGSIPTDFTDKELSNQDTWIGEVQSNGNCIYYYTNSYGTKDSADGFSYYERKLYRINADGTAKQEIISGHLVAGG